jgi:rubredoxin
MRKKMTNQANSSLEAKQFIEALFSGYFKDHDGYVEVRAIGETTVSKWLPKGEISETDWDEVINHNKTHHIYFGVNPRPLSKEKKEKDVQSIVCLWTDVDGKDFADSKDAAYKSIGEFPLPPSIIVDSGHGYHCYWLLSEPFPVVSEDARLIFKQVLSGVIKKLGADKSKTPICSLLRLPGTLNIKDDEPLECRIINMEADLFYKLEDFADSIDTEYREPAIDVDEAPPVFGKKRFIVTQGDPTAPDEERKAAAGADVERLEVPLKIKRHIITGDLRTEKGKDHSRSGRDQTILYWILYGEYDYETVKSVFFNPYLGCSNRIRQEGEKVLREDTARALKFVQKNKTEGTAGSWRIMEIKKSPFIPREEKPHLINAFVVQDLLKGEGAAGAGYRKRASDTYYFFNREGKALMDLEGLDFCLFMRQRFDLPKKDFEEIKDAVKTAIWESNQEVEPRKLAHWDKKTFRLYVSNHANTIYRIDGDHIEACDNGVDGVFFETDPRYEPYEYHPELEVADYFRRTVSLTSVEAKGFKISVPTHEALGLSLNRFKDCYLDQFLISRAHFGVDDRYDLLPDEQRLLFLLYFYSLFFKSIQIEKPILCFVGLRESGKSFIATSVGKILFGDLFGASTFTKDKKDLAVVLGGNYYTVFDNVDSWVANDLLDLLCAAVTGAAEDKRELYSDQSQVRFTLDSFVAITSREPKFRRDDVVRRLLLFNTREILKARGRSDLWGSLKENRDQIMTEVIRNLNTIVKILKNHKGKQEQPCVNRMIADWESLIKKMAPTFPESLFLLQCMQKMRDRKSVFAIEEEPLHWVLQELVYRDEVILVKASTTDLYARLLKKADEMKVKDFSERYKNPKSLGKRLSHLRPELEKEYTMSVESPGRGKHRYSFGPLEEEGDMAKHECSVCGYTYDPVRGEPSRGIPSRTPFSELPKGWPCPRCEDAKAGAITRPRDDDKEAY